MVVSEYIPSDCEVSDSSPTYWYEGRCPYTDDLLRLPRTPLVEAIAQGLMHQLADHPLYSREGKMYGVLLVETPAGEQRVLKAFSGLLNGSGVVEGWVPPIPGRDHVALEEARTLAQLEAMKQDLIALHHLPERQQYAAFCQEFETRLQALALVHRQRKCDRQHQRQTLMETLSGEALAIALESLEEQSRRDGIERRQLKRQRDAVVHSLKQTVEQADQRMRELKQQRKRLSRQLQSLMHTTYRLTNFSGASLSLQQLISTGSIPTGTGDCCAPKLLHYAATNGLTPLAMAEFWWGASSVNGDKVQGAFYGACVERCQPLMGFLLSGLSQPGAKPLAIASSTSNQGGMSRPPRSSSFINLSVATHSPEPLPILYEDEWLIAVNKPAGLLSVPGRYSDRQDSVLSRLRYQLANGMTLIPAHRLDQDTSGILLLARDRQTYRYLSLQFQQRQVHKVYEAILSGYLIPDEGVIDLPLWGNPGDRPRQTVNWQLGKPSITHFQVIRREEQLTWVEFIPVTGRTHQLRVHAADPRGLGLPIVGDRLYGNQTDASRLYLHARELRFQHPRSKQPLTIQCPPNW